MYIHYGRCVSNYLFTHQPNGWNDVTKIVIPLPLSGRLLVWLPIILCVLWKTLHVHMYGNGRSINYRDSTA